MQDFDPAMLRRLAGTYRKRAGEEPGMSGVFLEIASDMEAHAAQIEAAKVSQEKGARRTGLTALRAPSQ